MKETGNLSCICLGFVFIIEAYEHFETGIG